MAVYSQSDIRSSDITADITHYNPHDVLDLSGQGLIQLRESDLDQKAKVVNLSNNVFQTWPDLGSLASSVEVLNVSGNNLHDLQIPFLSTMKSLKILILNDTQVRFIYGPPTEAIRDDRKEELRALAKLPSFEQIVAKNTFRNYQFIATKAEITASLGL